MLTKPVPSPGEIILTWDDEANKMDFALQL
jgi:hypothetical protein